jgi:hypothetical protein
MVSRARLSMKLIIRAGDNAQLLPTEVSQGHDIGHVARWSTPMK